MVHRKEKADKGLVGKGKPANNGRKNNQQWGAKPLLPPVNTGSVRSRTAKFSAQDHLPSAFRIPFVYFSSSRQVPFCFALSFSPFINLFSPVHNKVKARKEEAR